MPLRPPGLTPSGRPESACSKSSAQLSCTELRVDVVALADLLHQRGVDAEAGQTSASLSALLGQRVGRWPPFTIHLDSSSSPGRNRRADVLLIGPVL